MEKIKFKTIILAEEDRVFRIIHYVTLLILIGFVSLIFERLILKEYELVTSYAVFTSILFIAFILVKLKHAVLGGYLVIADLLGFAFYISYLHNGLNNAMLFAIPGILVLAGLMFPENEFYFFAFFAIVIIVIIGILEVNGTLIGTQTPYTISDVFDRSLVVLLSAIGIKIFSNEIRRSFKFAKDREAEIRVKIEEVTASESRFRSLFDNSLDPLLLVDETVQVVDCNKATVDFLNVKSKEEIINKDLLSFSDELQPDGLLSIGKFEEIKREMGRKSTKVIEWVFGSNNNKRYVEMSFTLIPFGNKSYYLSHWRDITERKIYENELKEKQLFIERVTEQSPDIIYILNVIKNEFIFVNQNVGGLLGYTQDDLPADFNSSFKMLIHPDDISVFTNYHKNIEEMEGKYKFEYEYRLKAQDGTWKWFAGREKEFQRENGKTITVLGVLTDVSERKKIEEAIKLSEEKFSKAFKSSPVSINITRFSDGKFIDVNNTFETLTGYKRDEVIGTDAKELGIWYDTNEGVFLFDVVLKQNKVKDHLVNFLDKYGNSHICRYTSERIELNGEECLLAIVNDITDQYKTEQALIEAEMKFGLVFKSSPNALLITSYEEKIVLEINDVALKIFGKKRDEVIGKSLHELQFLSEEDRNKLVESLETLGVIDGIEMRVEFNGVSKVGLFYGLKLEMNNAVNIFLTVVDITELIETSNALKQREELYRTLMENMNEAVLQTDLEDKVTYVNNRFENVLGYNPNEVLGKSIYQFLLDAEDSDFVKRANEKRKNKVYEQYEMKLKHKDGYYLNFLISASPVIEPSGEVSGSIGVMTDITDMLKAIEQLKTSEEKFRLIAENSADIISIQTIDGKFKYLSPSCFSIIGYYPEELIGQTPVFFIKPEYKEKFLNVYSQNYQKKSLYTVTFEATAKDGRDIWLESTSIIVKDSNNSPKEIQTLTRDITERKNIELVLEDAIRFNNLVMNSLPIALISVERNLTVNLYNEAALKYKKEIKGEEKLFNLFPILNSVKSKIQETILNIKQTESLNSISDESGDLKYLKFIISPIERLGKYGCVILIDDITHFRNMEQLMIQSEKMMSVAGLAAGMAHEINNPLGTIVQGCQNIIRRVSKELPKNIETARNLGVEIDLIDSYFQQRQIFEIIDSMRFASAKAADIIKNMLQFSRKSESKMVMYSVESLLEQTSELANSDYDFKKKYDYKSINVIKEYQPGLPEIKMTVTEMEQVVFNLIRNAVQAMRNDEASNKIPTIILRTLRDEKYVKIEVEDNGPGIPEKIISRIFEPFFTTKEVGEGTGLGLSVSYMIVTKNHKGKIEVDSKIGKGTKFIIKLPI